MPVAATGQSDLDIACVLPSNETRKQEGDWSFANGMAVAMRMWSSGRMAIHSIVKREISLTAKTD